ncbi:hypothetical protein FDP41_009042 [Naegleria fowleri]|uniref:C3H1-type domain-containing protein n=1 Tax=Naegleria fowleri TaxID=5763 RepID=A0A6A5AZM2_NAEFO|nr:uncharacterized protein FDP41_009042 [Naegleria fowleri]KAF0972793.1 hypothetical protein FDP41_009042 [Naegleria fowleri]
MSPTMDTSIPMKKKVKTDDKSLTPTLGEEYSSSSTTGKKKKKVSWSSELEKVKLIEPRSAHIEENAGQNSNGVHKTVQELLNEEKSRERTLLNQQRQLKQLILSNMKNTVPGVSPLRPIIKEHKSDQIPDLSSTEASRIAAEVQKSQSKIVHESPKSPDTVPNIAEISNLLSSFNRLNPMMTNVAVTSNAGHSASSMPTSYATPSPFSTSSTLHHHTTIVSPSISPSVATTVFQQSPSYYRPQQAQVPPPPQQQPIFTPIMTNISQPPPQPPQQPPSHHPSRQPNHHHHAHNRQSNRNQQQSNKPRPPLNPPPPPQGPVEPRSFKPIKCLFYLKGNCKNGTKCGFYHEGYDIPPQEGVEEYNFEKAKYFQSLKNSTVGTSTQNNPSSNRR